MVAGEEQGHAQDAAEAVDHEKSQGGKTEKANGHEGTGFQVIELCHFPLFLSSAKIV